MTRDDEVIAHLPAVAEAFAPVLDAIRAEDERRLLEGDGEPVPPTSGGEFLRGIFARLGEAAPAELGVDNFRAALDAAASAPIPRPWPPIIMRPTDFAALYGRARDALLAEAFGVPGVTARPYVHTFVLDDGSPVEASRTTARWWRYGRRDPGAPAWVIGGGNARQRRKRRRAWERTEAALVDAFRDDPGEEPWGAELRARSRRR